MTLTGRFEFVNSKEMDGRGKNEGKKFYNVTLMQDDEVIQLFADEKLYNKTGAFKRLEQVNVNIRISTREEKTYFNLVNIEKSA